jgi:RNA polymerase sigma-70 factor (ECF subfamily)
VELVAPLASVHDRPSHPANLRLVMSGSHESDALVARFKAGDRTAFRDLFARHRNDVVRLVYRMLGARGDVDDVVQEVFLQVHRSLRDFRGDAKFSTWLHRVAVNVVLMVRRAAKSRPMFTGELPEDASNDDAIWPDEDASRRERMRAFQRCIDKLSDKKRTVFILHELEGMPAAEISEVVEAPVLTVRTRLFYARKELAQLMREEPTLATFAETFERGSTDKTTEDAQ